MSNRIAVVGSRDFSDWRLVQDFLDWLLCLGEISAADVIVSGGARGVDRIAVMWARKRGIAVHEFPAEWQLYGRGAGMRRNVDIVSSSDRIIAFWDGQSPGTYHSIGLATKQGKPLLVVDDLGRHRAVRWDSLAA